MAHLCEEFHSFKSFIHISSFSHSLYFKCPGPSPTHCSWERPQSVDFISLDGSEEHTPLLLRRASHPVSIPPPPIPCSTNQIAPPTRLHPLRPGKGMLLFSTIPWAHQFLWRVDNGQRGSFFFAKVHALVPRQFRFGQEKTSSLMKIPPLGADYRNPRKDRMRLVRFWMCTLGVNHKTLGCGFLYNYYANTILFNPGRNFIHFSPSFPVCNMKRMMIRSLWPH